MRLEAYGATDVGKVKENNEDCYWADPARGIFVMADGMGGHAAGEVASQMAVELVADALLPQADELAELALRDTPESRDELFKRLEASVHHADLVIYERSEKEEDKRGMATTLDVMFLSPTGAFIAHVGDSRAYMVRAGQAFQLTTDHTLANHLRAEGRVPLDEIEKMPQRHALVRAVGMAGGAHVDMIHIDVMPGDRFLLCTDGLSNYLRNLDVFVEIVTLCMSEKSVARMIRHANDAGGRDNITAMLISVEHVEEGPRKSLDTTLKLKVLKQVSLLNGLDDQETLQFLRLTHEIELAAGEVVIREGDPGSELFVVLEGEVEVESAQVALTRLGPGAPFGELALVDDRPRSATVRTTEKARLLVLRREDFRVLTRTGDLAPKLLWNLINDITDRLRTTSWQLTEQVRLSQGS